MFLVYKADTEETVRERIDAKLQTNTRWFGTKYAETTSSNIAKSICSQIRDGQTRFWIEGPGYKFHVHALME